MRCEIDAGVGIPRRVGGFSDKSLKAAVGWSLVLRLTRMLWQPIAFISPHGLPTFLPLCFFYPAVRSSVGNSTLLFARLWEIPCLVAHGEASSVGDCLECHSSAASRL